MAFLGSFLQYVIIMAILVLLAVVGARLGIRMRKNKDAKEAANAEADIMQESAKEE